MRDKNQRGGGQTDRRNFLMRLGTAGTALAGAHLASRTALAEDQALDALIGDTQRGQYGQSFDDASRTIHMPTPSEPTVSAATAHTTEKAIEHYADIVGRGGWPQVPSVSELRLGDRSPSVPRFAPGSRPQATSIQMRSATKFTIPTWRPRCAAFRPAMACRPMELFAGKPWPRSMCPRRRASPNSKST